MPRRKGIPPWSKESIAEAFRAYHAQHGRWPQTTDCYGHVGLPHITTIGRISGSLTQARLDAGMSPEELKRQGQDFDAAWLCLTRLWEKDT